MPAEENVESHPRKLGLAFPQPMSPSSSVKAVLHHKRVLDFVPVPKPSCRLGNILACSAWSNVVRSVLGRSELSEMFLASELRRVTDELQPVLRAKRNSRSRLEIFRLVVDSPLGRSRD